MAGDQNDHDMDSIAGVLKLYFRGLEHPLFPKDIFHDLIACVSKYRKSCKEIGFIFLISHLLFFPIFPGSRVSFWGFFGSSLSIHLFTAILALT